VSDETPNQAPQTASWWKTNQGAGTILTVFFALILLYVLFLTDAFRPLRDGFLLGFFPIMTSAMCVGFAALMLVDHLRKKVMPDYARLDWKFVCFVIGAIAWCGVFFWFLVEIGFVVTAPFFMFGLIYTLGLRPARTAFLAGAAISAAVFAIFWIIGARLPIGPEWLMEKWGLPVVY
jgi:hypothetical protein